jgi:hypothetical protein
MGKVKGEIKILLSIDKILSAQEFATVEKVAA